MCSAVRSSGLLTLFEEASSLRKLLVVVDRCGGCGYCGSLTPPRCTKLPILAKAGEDSAQDNAFRKA